MSWGLLVATYDRPDTGAVSALVEGTEYSARGVLDESRGNVLVQRREQPAFTVDGPVCVEHEDLPEELAAVVLAPRFQVEISVPIGGSVKDRTFASKLARALAEKFQGAVYDPQKDEVIWPKRRLRSFSPPAGEERIRVVELTWYFGGRSPDPEIPRKLLQELRRSCAEALPRRYGDFEPLQKKLEPGKDAELITFWKTQAKRDGGGSFFWKSQSPCFGGHVYFPDRRETRNGTRRCTVLSMNFDGRALDADARWCESVVALFVRVAERLDAFYGAAHVERGVIARRGLWYDSESESVSMPGHFFAGLPPFPTWLAWFGRSYSSLVADVMSDHPGAELRAEKNLFLRTGATPLDTDQLRGEFPTLPPSLVFSFEGRSHSPARIVPA